MIYMIPFSFHKQVIPVPAVHHVGKTRIVSFCYREKIKRSAIRIPRRLALRKYDIMAAQAVQPRPQRIQLVSCDRPCGAFSAVEIFNLHRRRMLRNVCRFRMFSEPAPTLCTAISECRKLQHKSRRCNHNHGAKARSSVPPETSAQFPVTVMRFIPFIICAAISVHDSPKFFPAHTCTRFPLFRPLPYIYGFGRKNYGLAEIIFKQRTAALPVSIPSLPISQNHSRCA